jgi:hypothetical protein
MKRNLLLLLAICTIGLLGSCNIADNFKYGSPTKEFMGYLAQKDYNKCVAMMNTSKAKKADIDALKINLDGFRTKLVADFGEKVDYSYMRIADARTMGITYIPNSTNVLMQISNDKELGVIEVIFDNKTNDIINVKALQIKEPIPSMTDFWIFGIVCLLIPSFNIYVIRKVWRSNMSHKWLRTLVIIVVNVCAVGCVPVKGLVFTLLKLQPVLGINFIKMGYLGSSWVLGIPLGGIYMLWLLKTGNYQKAPVTQKATTTQVKGKRFKAKG